MFTIGKHVSYFTKIKYNIGKCHYELILLPCLLVTLVVKQREAPFKYVQKKFTDALIFP